MSATKAQIARVIAAFEQAGRPVTAACICANGDVLLLTKTPLEALPSEDDGDWVSLAGQTAGDRALGN